MRDSAKILMKVEMLLQPSMYVLGLVLGLVHSMQHSVWGSLPYLLQISTIIFSYWVQMKTLKNAPPFSSFRNTVEGCRVRYQSAEAAYQRCSKQFPLLGGYGQVFGMWTHDDEGKWVKAWSQLPAVGHVTGALSGWLSVPVILTIHAVINYGISRVGFPREHKVCGDAVRGSCQLRPAWRSCRKILVNSTGVVTFDCVLQVLTFGSRRASWPCRGNRAVASRRRTSWFRCSSPWVVGSSARCSSTKKSRAPISPQVIGGSALVCFLFANIPALFVTACVFKLVGIFACSTTHLLNLTSGCVE